MKRWTLRVRLQLLMGTAAVFQFLAVFISNRARQILIDSLPAGKANVA